ncbi:hypothetical protein Bca52824_023984 [Brassica carinata]|uniref:Uncharacterized protein n=1 Tax=Brassica carinata TaxID=52824 RepID=A0A8X8AV48_BRACI|nr:hypothetical protein Bca52824_023984 [Brassica carinata]
MFDKDMEKDMWNFKSTIDNDPMKFGFGSPATKDKKKKGFKLFYGAFVGADCRCVVAEFQELGKDYSAQMLSTVTQMKAVYLRPVGGTTGQADNLASPKQVDTLTARSKLQRIHQGTPRQKTSTDLEARKRCPKEPTRGSGSKGQQMTSPEPSTPAMGNKESGVGASI